jgi:c-di-GMP-binding flagellar brake protein YcgR
MNEEGKAKQPKKKEKTRTVKKEDEQRKVARLKEEHEIMITIVSEDENLPNENVLYNFSKDISESGVKIQGNIPLPVDTLLRIDLTIESLHQKITAFGKVKWIKSNIEDGTYEAGVEFVDTSGEAIRKIEDYILRKQKYTNLNPVGVPFWIFAKFNSAKEK